MWYAVECFLEVEIDNITLGTVVIIEHYGHHLKRPVVAESWSAVDENRIDDDKG